MRIKILMLGADPSSLIANAELLKEQGFLVMTAFDPQNINELVSEIKSDIVFFDQHKQDNQISNACNNFVNDTHFTNIPVILTLSDDDAYVVSKERTGNNGEQKMMADNIIDAIQKALQSTPAPARQIPLARKKRTHSPAPQTKQLF